MVGIVLIAATLIIVALAVIRAVDQFTLYRKAKQLGALIDQTKEFDDLVQINFDLKEICRQSRENVAIIILCAIAEIMIFIITITNM